MYLCSPRAPQSPLRLFSRDVTVWLFRLYWILFPEMSQLVISSLLEVIVSFPPVLTRGPLKSSQINTVQFQKGLQEEELGRVLFE